MQSTWPLTGGASDPSTRMPPWVSPTKTAPSWPIVGDGWTTVTSVSGGRAIGCQVSPRSNETLRAPTAAVQYGPFQIASVPHPSIGSTGCFSLQVVPASVDRWTQHWPS